MKHTWEELMANSNRAVAWCSTCGIIRSTLYATTYGTFTEPRTDIYRRPKDLQYTEKEPECP